MAPDRALLCDNLRHQLATNALLRPSPLMILHPLEKTEGGLTQVEVRAWQESVRKDSCDAGHWMNPFVADQAPKLSAGEYRADGMHHGGFAVTSCDLRYQGILVTRPAHQAERLCQLIETAGGWPLRFPTLVIEPTHDPAARALLAQHWDLAYCVSPNAVIFAHALADDRQPWLRAERVAAVGAGTARALEALGCPADLVPSGRFESEEVLAMPELSHLDGRRVLIVRGEGGRGLMAETLRQRGARVSIAEVYRRFSPQVDPRPLLARWSSEVDWVTVTSEQILRNLMAILGPAGREPLLATPLVVIAARTAQVARTFGFRDVVLAERASDEAILAALCGRAIPG